MRGFRLFNCGDTHVTSQLPFVRMDRIEVVNRVSCGMQSHGGVRLESHPRVASAPSHYHVPPFCPFCSPQDEGSGDAI